MNEMSERWIHRIKRADLIEGIGREEGTTSDRADLLIKGFAQSIADGCSHYSLSDKLLRTPAEILGALEVDGEIKQNFYEAHKRRYPDVHAEIEAGEREALHLEDG